MKVIAAILSLLFIALVGGLVFIYSGIYNVAAVESHTSVTTWVLRTIKDNSIKSRVGGIDTPLLTDPEMIEEGLAHFHEMCVTCHGAPGFPPSEVGRGLNSQPPDLAEEAEEMSPAELFWVTKNGIKMTGMPAFGPTHTDQQIWAIVALLRSLHEMDEAEYRSRLDAAGLQGSGSHGDHDHGGEAIEKEEKGPESSSQPSAGGHKRKPGADHAHRHPQN